jgi:GxxExxY protein
LAEEMSARGIPFQREKPLRILYKGAEVGYFEADFLVDEKVIVELKAAKGLLLSLAN